ncbi:DUF4397 domain-containing protein [Jeotgalibacillus soli]|uniref:DUF4397 domain-containing protein n=1 Tax=Jeotgalibacillus soli TaxID=889306 RepID=A0A0C2R6G5_9BACL|nr:DUF4397 domain-containing protein [Jeotgalibacillus soli]KIL45850.1 hypothetical protein KP78_21990 [Jeotgalibacillus soli]
MVDNRTTMVRAAHFSPDAPAVDVGLLGGEAVFSGASFQGVTDFAELEASTYDLKVRTPDGTQIIDLSETVLDAGTAYSVYAVNTLDSIELLLLTAHELTCLRQEWGRMATENNSIAWSITIALVDQLFYLQLVSG